MAVINTLKLYQALNKAFSKEQTEQLVHVFSEVTEELAVVVTKEEFKDLKASVVELVEAQKRTETRVEELAEAQTRTEERMEELVEAQRRTEVTLGGLWEAVQDLRTEVGSLSSSMGYGLEDLAYFVLPAYIERTYGIKDVKFSRRFIKLKKKEVEINLYGEGKKNGVPIILLGEVENKIWKGGVKEFAKTLEAIEKEQVLDMHKPVFRFMFAYWIHPSAVELAREKSIEMIATYKLT